MIDLEAVFFFEEFLKLQHLKSGDSLVPYLKECLGRNICEENKQETKSINTTRTNNPK